MGCHPSHWLSHIFKDGYCTTSQILLFIFISLHHIISPLWLVRNCKIAINCSLWITAFSNIPQSSYINTPIDSIVLSHHSSEQTKAKNHLVGALEHFFHILGSCHHLNCYSLHDFSEGLVAQPPTSLSHQPVMVQSWWKLPVFLAWNHWWFLKKHQFHEAVRYLYHKPYMP